MTHPLKWHGGKTYLAKWLHSLAPPHFNDDKVSGYTHRNIVFGGGLGEFWGWPHADTSEAVNDLNRDLANFWWVLKNPEAFEQFYSVVNVTPYSQESWQTAKQMLDSKSGLDHLVWRAAQFFIVYRMSRQGLGSSYSTPTRRVRRGMNENVSAWLSAVDGLPECHARLRSVELRNMDCEEFIDAYDHPRALFYCDPPYLHETRVTTGEYEHEMGEDAHVCLLEKLAAIEGKFMLSGYPSDLYDDFAREVGWRRHERLTPNHASGKSKKDAKRECVWTNY